MNGPYALQSPNRLAREVMWDLLFHQHVHHSLNYLTMKLMGIQIHSLKKKLYSLVWIKGNLIESIYTAPRPLQLTLKESMARPMTYASSLPKPQDEW